MVKKNKPMWDVFQARADNNPHLSRNYRIFLVNKAILNAMERKADE